MTTYAWRTFQNSIPQFIADHNSMDRDTGAKIDWSRVGEAYMNATRYTVKANGAAAAAATSITVDALPVDLPVGTKLDFAGAGEVAILTAPAEAGATTISVEALDAGVEDNDEATYFISKSQTKFIPAGTAMCRLSTGLIVPRVARPGSETAFCLLASNATEGAGHNANESFGCLRGGIVYENLLPDYANAAWATIKGELQTAGVGTGWGWVLYEDDRGA